MSNGERWRTYIHHDSEIEKIEAYLKNPVPASNYLNLMHLRVPLKALIDDTDFTKSPTNEWYALHTCVNDNKKWTQRLLAWGINRKRTDMFELQYKIVSYIMEAKRNATSNDRSADTAVLALHEIDNIFQRGYENMAPKFVDAVIPASWYVSAQYQFITRCKQSAIKMLDRGLYDQESYELTQASKDHWESLFRNSDLPEELVRSSFALVSDGEDPPTRKDDPTNINCLPAELVARVLDYALDPPTLGRLPDLAKTNKWLLANA